VGYAASDINYIVNESALEVAMADVPISQELVVGELRKARRSVTQAAYARFLQPDSPVDIGAWPNEGHRIIAGLEGEFKVTVITQNGDDFHERAGSTNVIHLHGEALKNASTMHPYEAFEIDRNNPDIRIGDKVPDGSQIRPYVIF